MWRWGRAAPCWRRAGEDGRERRRMAMRDSSGDDDAEGGFPPRPDPTVPATAVVDAHGVVTGWSSEAERLLGYGHAEVVGRPAVRLLGTEADRSTEWFLATPFGRGGSSLLRRRDGRPLEVSVRIYPSLDVLGRPQRLIVLSPVDRRRWGAVDGLVEDAFDQAILPMAIFDDELRTLRTSLGMRREAGRTEEQLRGQRPSEFLPGSAGEALDEGVRRVLASGEASDLHPRVRSRAAPVPRTWTITLSPAQRPAAAHPARPAHRRRHHPTTPPLSSRSPTAAAPPPTCAGPGSSTRADGGCCWWPRSPDAGARATPRRARRSGRRSP